MDVGLGAFRSIGDAVRVGFHGPPGGPEPGGPGTCHGPEACAWRYTRGSSLWPLHSGFAELEAPEAAPEPQN